MTIRALRLARCGHTMVVFMPANVPRWHGASSSEAATCVHAYPGGVAITMMEEVTEDDYLGKM